MIKNSYLPLISVIVPVFNVEKYLDDCITSLLNQTYENIEIILVDDGSTDSSPSICENYAKKSNKIKIIHKTNGGLSDARNAGLKVAKGDYIAFVDSDDYVHPEMYTFLLKAIQEYDCSMATCKFTRNEENFSKPLEYKEISKKYISSTTAMNDIGLVWVTAWNKLYSKELLDCFKYKVNCYHEDEFAIHELLYKAETIITLDAPLYFYRVTPNSIINSKDYDKQIKKIKDSQEAFKSRIDFILEKQWLETLPSAVRRYCDNSIEKYELVKNDLNGNKKLIQEIQNNTRKVLSNCPDLSVSRRYKVFSKNILLFELVKVFAGLLAFVRAKKRKIINILKLILNLPTSDVALLRKQINLKIKFNRIPPIKREKNEIIVSLTTYGDRFKEIKYTLYSLFKQKTLPDKIILWLDEKEFSEKDIELNKTLQKFKKKGLIIRYCPNYGSYKKIIPCISEYPDSKIIICDDDAYYEKHWLEKLLREEKKYPDFILCHSANYLLIKENRIQPYQTWNDSIIPEEEVKTLPIGVGGTLLKSCLLYKDFANSELFMKLAPNGDDLWIWAQTVLNNRLVKLINNCNKNPIDMGQDRNWQKLYVENAFASQNDVKINNILAYYPELQMKLGVKLNKNE